MKFALKRPFKENIYSLIRKAGYYFQKKTNEDLIFTRPAKVFPRFHLFVKVIGENLICNLHLDQKAPIYKGAPAHAGEYEGEVVEKEAERIKEFFRKYGLLDEKNENSNRYQY